MRPRDPRIRQRLNQVSTQLESANVSTQAYLFGFSQNYVSPCLSSLKVCLEASCQPCYECYTAREDQRRLHRGARRGRDNLGFDFYDDWDEEDDNWGNDELDRLLAGSDEQPGRRAGMSYGSGIVGRKSMGGVKDERNDSNMVPKSSMFGFLERLPWNIGGRGVRYRPSVADLQENVGRGTREAEPLIEESDDNEAETRRGRHTRNRSGTANSWSTTNSLSSRGDLFPSEDEDDAVPLDDEFAMVLGRRNTGGTLDDRSSKNSKTKKPARSRTSTKTVPSKDTKESRKSPRSTSSSSKYMPDMAEPGQTEVPSMIDLKHEEEQVRNEEEAEVESRRDAAQRLAQERCLNDVAEVSTEPQEGDDELPETQSEEVKSEPTEAQAPLQNHPETAKASSTTVTVEPKLPDDQT